MSAYYNENDPHAAQWLRNLIAAGEIPDGDVDERSIVDVRGDALAGYGQCHFFAGVGTWARALRDAGWPEDRQVWTGSCPCQPLSVAGQRKGALDQRHLWPAFHRLIAERRPATVVGEQVADKDGREWMAAVRHDLEAGGYAVGTAILPAASVGAPHIRYRLFFVADAQGDRSGARRLGDDGEGASAGRSSGLFAVGGRSSGGLADADQGQRGRLADGQRRERDGQAGGWIEGDCLAQSGGVAGRPGSPDGFWSDADWIFCRDDKWRPIEPGSFPLVDGSAFDLGSGGPYEGMSRARMLRGYGNAIVLPVAVAFVEAAMEVLPCT
jgi:DNA (cytosine-5)-methyltransferase 1